MTATILIIESDHETGRLADYLLRASGYETVSEGDTARAMNIALSGDADLILCGLDTDDADGFGVMAKLRDDPAWRSVPVVGLTRRHKPSDHQRIKSSGFAACLHKPIEPEIFVSQVERLLPARLRRPQPLSS